MWSKQDLGYPGTCSSHTLECPTHPPGTPTLANSREAAPSRHRKLPHRRLPSVRAPPLSGGLCVNCLRPLVQVPAGLRLGPTRSTRLGEGGEGGGPSVGQGKGLPGRPHLCSLRQSVWVLSVCLISVPSCFSLSACVLVSACLPPSVSLLSTNLPHLFCSSVITPGQECYLISSLLAASGLHPLPFFLPADACLPWQP